jgi:hypothetical protein
MLYKVFSLSHYDRRRIWTPRFIIGSWSNFAWVSWRVFSFLYVISVSTFNVIISHSASRYFTFLTTQSLWLVVSYFSLALACTIVVLLQPSLGKGAVIEPLRCNNTMSSFLWSAMQRACVLIFSIAVPFQLVVVTLYWLLLATPFPNPEETWNNIESHGIKLVFVMCDVIFSAQRLPENFLSFTLFCAFIYLIINLCVTLLTYPVYNILSWRSVGTAIIVIGALFFIVFCFAVAITITAIRDRFSARIRNSQSSSNFDSELYSSDSWPSIFEDDPTPYPCSTVCLWCTTRRCQHDGVNNVNENNDDGDVSLSNTLLYGVVVGQGKEEVTETLTG